MSEIVKNRVRWVPDKDAHAPNPAGLYRACCSFFFSSTFCPWLPRSGLTWSLCTCPCITMLSCGWTAERIELTFGMKATTENNNYSMSDGLRTHPRRRTPPRKRGIGRRKFSALAAKCKRRHVSPHDEVATHVATPRSAILSSWWTLLDTRWLRLSIFASSFIVAASPEFCTDDRSSRCSAPCFY